MSIETTRRAALAVLSLTLAAWWRPGFSAPAELRIGIQKGSFNLVVLKQRALLDKRLPGTRVTWAEFPAGPQLLEALAVGSVDVGATGDSPPVTRNRTARVSMSIATRRTGGCMYPVYRETAMRWRYGTL